MRRLASITSICGVIFAVAPSAPAQTWSGTTDGTWNTATNWTSPVGIPSSANTTRLLFGSATTTAMTDNIAGTFTLNAMTFSTGDPAYSLTGNALSFQTSPSSVAPTLVMNSNAGLTIGDSISLVNPLTISGSGTGTVTLNGLISGAGGLTYAGSGTLVLKNTGDAYTGGTTVASGTLSIGATGNILPAGSAVTVQTGAVLDFGPYTQSNALSILTLAGTLHATGATSSDLGTQQLIMTGGSVDFSNLPFTWLHITSATGITTNASSTTATWIGANNSELINDAGNVAMPITVAAGTTANGIDLDVSLKLACRSSSALFTKLGPGTMRLTNPANTAPIYISGGTLRVDDMAALGSGGIWMDGATLAYGGPSATSAKQVAVTTTQYSTFRVLNPGTNLTLTSPVLQTAAGGALYVQGSGVPGQPSTLTLTATPAFNGGVGVGSQAILALPTFDMLSPSYDNDAMVILGYNGARGDLLLTGTAANYLVYGADFNAGANTVPAELFGLYATHGGGGIGVQNAGTTLTLDGALIGPGSFIKTGAGTVVLAGGNTLVPNSWLGGTYIEGGTLVPSDPSQLHPFPT